MKLEELQNLYRIIKSSNVNTVELSKKNVFIRMVIQPMETVSYEENKNHISQEKTNESNLSQSEAEEPLVIKSDNVGIFYTHSGALEKPLVNVGDVIKKGQVVGYIVSMGISYNLVSQVEGRVTVQRVRHKEPVEYGEIIFELEKE